MKNADRQKQDPLAGIEDMLSSLCGAQKTRTEFRNDITSDCEDKDQEVQRVEDSPSSDDEGATTPEINTSPKPRQRKRTASTRKQTQPGSSKKIPPAKRIRKSKKRGNNRQTGPRRTLQATSSSDFVDVEQQADDIVGTSSDDQENAIFLNQMKRLAEEHLNANQRKNDAMNANAVNTMKRHTDECVQQMKQIAGKVSSDIIRGATAIEEALPGNMKEETAAAMNAIKTANDGLSDLLSQAKSFEEHVNTLVQEVQEKRKKNKEKHDTEQNQIRENAERITESGEQLTSVLKKIEEMIDLDQFN